MSTRTVAAHLLVITAGILVAFYALYVEAMLIGVPGYQPSCDISSFQMSCSKVFNSKYAKILSYWGLVPKGGHLDFSLPQFALLYFIACLFLPLIVRRFPRTKSLWRSLSYAVVCFNLYLAYILKYKLGEFCIVCVTNYAINAGVLYTTHMLTSSSSISTTKKAD
jgi:vitamin-K-epoxide reductase (warfarin-sensitive)